MAYNTGIKYKVDSTRCSYLSLNGCQEDTLAVFRCKLSPHCGFRSYRARPVGTLRPGSGPCWAADAEPRCPLRGGTGAGYRNGTPKPGLTLKLCCSKPSAQACCTQPVGTRQGAGLEEPSRRSWEPCRGRQRPSDWCRKPRGRCNRSPQLLFAKFYLCLRTPRLSTEKLR